MPTQQERLEQAKTVLDRLAQENIELREMATSSVLRKLNVLRDAMWSSAKAHEMFAPGLTASAAITLLKVAGCNEVCQRFILDYYLTFKTAEASMVFMVDINDPSNNHVVVMLGEVLAPEEIFLDHTLVVSEKKNLTISQFLSSQNEHSVIVDPLLNSYGDRAAIDLTAYCTKHKITHVTSIVEYTSPIVIEKAETIKANAVMLASEVNRKIVLELLNKAMNSVLLRDKSLEQWKYHSVHQYFYIKGTDALLAELYRQLQTKFTSGDDGDVRIVNGTTGKNKYLIIKKKAHELDYATLHELISLSPVVMDAMRHIGFLKISSKAKEDRQLQAQPSTNTSVTPRLG